MGGRFILNTLSLSRWLGFDLFFGFDQRFFALDVGFAAFFMFVFIVLFAHKCLYNVRVLRFCGCTMKVYERRFNLYLALLVMVALFMGCKTEKKKEKEKLSAVRIHLQSNPSESGTTQTVLYSPVYAGERDHWSRPGFKRGKSTCRQGH